jgi:hypothetical protein
VIELDVAGLSREQLPVALSELARLEGEVRLRLSDTTPTPPSSRLLTVVEAAAIVGMSKRWLRSKTRGRRFRHDLSRKVIRFDEAGLRAWFGTGSG